MYRFLVLLHSKSFECEQLIQVEEVFMKLVYADELADSRLSALVPATVLNRTIVTNCIVTWITPIIANTELQVRISSIVRRILRRVIVCDEKNSVHANLSLGFGFDGKPRSLLRIVRGVKRRKT